MKRYYYNNQRPFYNYFEDFYSVKTQSPNITSELIKSSIKRSIEKSIKLFVLIHRKINDDNVIKNIIHGNSNAIINIENNKWREKYRKNQKFDYFFHFIIFTNYLLFLGIGHLL